MPGGCPVGVVLGSQSSGTCVLSSQALCWHLREPLAAGDASRKEQLFSGGLAGEMWLLKAALAAVATDRPLQPFPAPPWAPGLAGRGIRHAHTHAVGANLQQGWLFLKDCCSGRDCVSRRCWMVLLALCSAAASH